MAYSDFTPENVEQLLDVTIQVAPLFPNCPTAAISEWLASTLKLGSETALVSEKSRSEFIVAPILLAARQLCEQRFSIFSGKRLDVDAVKGLVGECDFILAITPPLPILHAPIMTLVEAKKHDVEEGFGQCIAQMVAAKKFNEVDFRKNNLTTIYGCVTNGVVWRFLKLTDGIVILDQTVYTRENVDRILGVLVAIYQESAKSA